MMKTFRRTNLDIVSTEALIDELANRYDAMSVLGWKNLDKGRNEQLIEFRGPRHTVLGMIAEAAHKLPWMD